MSVAAIQVKPNILDQIIEFPVEVRIPKAKGKNTTAGYFDNMELLKKAVKPWDGRKNIYFTINPVDTALLSRYHNRLEDYALSTTKDNDIPRLKKLLIDNDVIRPSDISATDKEKEKAIDKTKEIREYLMLVYGIDTWFGDSGNGGHVLINIDLPKTPENEKSLQNILIYLGSIFDDIEGDIRVKVDRTTYNPSRITKLYGTVAVKGDSTAERPHRRSCLIEAPSTLAPQDITALIHDANEYVKEQEEAKRRHHQPVGNVSSAVGIDAQEWLTRHHIGIARIQQVSYGTLYILDTCPMDSSHEQNHATSLIQLPSGALKFKCLHDRCSHYTWADLRGKYEPKSNYSGPLDWDGTPEKVVTPEPAYVWPEPEEIQTKLAPVESLPPEIIPEPFRDWLVDISHRMQCPIDFVAAAALVVAGSVVGAGCGIRPKQKDDWLVVPNLWGGIVGRPSMLKTPSLTEVMKPLSRLEVEARQEYEARIDFYEADREVYKATKEAIKSDMLATARGKKKNTTMDALKEKMAELAEPETPIRRRFKTNDATIEKIGELLNDNPRGMMLFRDELVGLLVNWEREDRQQDRAFYLESWNGYGSFTCDRIGRGTIDTDNLCISILGGIQPAKLTGYLYQAADNLKNDGLMQRFQLLVYPDEPATWKNVDEWPNIAAKERAFTVISSLAEAKFIQYGAEDDVIPFFHFDRDAQVVFNDWLGDLQRKLTEEDNPVIEEHLAKYRSLMPSLALLFHLVDLADGTSSGQVSSDAALKAVVWCEYLESHARRIYGMLGDVSTRAAAELAAKLRKGMIPDGFASRDIYRKHWHLLDTKEIVQDALNELIEAGWLLKKDIITGGRPTSAYYINPKIYIQTHNQRSVKGDKSIK